jgi:lipopolysaccharide biosynthesis glycosyltransferase
VEHRRGPAEADTVHCAVVLPRGAGLSLSVLVASLLDHCSRPLRHWVLARPGTEGVERRLAGRFPELSFTWLPLRGLGRDLETPTGSRPPAAGLIRLLIPELLPDVDRVVVLPLPAVATGDLADLADLDLDGHTLAAPREPGSTTSASGFGVIHAAAARLDEQTDAAAELRRLAHARHAFDFDAFTTRVLVLDLAGLRAEGFAAEALSLVEAFGLDDLEVLHHMYGPARAEVPDRWAFVPTRMPYRGPGLIHWADRVKPWHKPLTPERDRWRRYATALRKADAPARA